MDRTSLLLACALLASAAQAAVPRFTADHVRAHAQAHMDRNEPEGAALDVATLRLVGGRPGRDVGPISAWLAARARAQKTAALAAQARGDAPRAAALYVSAVQTDPLLLREDDHGLEGCAGALPAPGYARGFYHYQRSELAAAEAEFRAGLAHEADPYRRWIGGLWLADVAALKAAQAAQDDRDRAERRQRAVVESAKAERVLAEIATRPASETATDAATDAPADEAPAGRAEPSAPPAEPEAPAGSGSRRRSDARAVVGMDGKPVDGVVVKDHWNQQILVGSDGKAHGIVRNGRVVVGFDGKPIGVTAP